LKSEMRKEVNPSAPRHKCRGLLRVDPERRFLSPPSKAGLSAVQRVKTQIKDNELVRSKRLQIAIGASKLFIKKGYFQTSIREISKATGLTIGNLYDYITKKEDILFLVFEVFHSTWGSRLEEEGVFAIKDPALQLDTALQKMLDLVNTHREMVLLMYTESKLLPKGFLRIILDKESELVRYFETILKRGIEKGVFKVKDPFFAANMIVYLLSVEPMRGWNLRGRYRIDDINKQLMQFIKQAVTG
jgi:AcrR family transcriptional regulator